MLRVILAILLFPGYLFAQAGDPFIRRISYRGNQFYQLKTGGNSKLIIFLHGGLTNPAFAEGKEIPDAEFLLEGNADFLRMCREHGFDVLLPVANTQMNWLSNYENCFQTLKGFVDSTGLYEQYFISGFSDGGTGSYRIFYSYPKYFNGLIVFNGYPQLNNFYRQVDYQSGKLKKVIFCSTNSDNTIPYEFLLTEYAKQKLLNPDTYLFVVNGKHSFNEYRSKQLQEVFSMIETTPDNWKTNPVHGYIRRDSLVEFYEFRQKVFKKYGYDPVFREENKVQRKALKK